MEEMREEGGEFPYPLQLTTLPSSQVQPARSPNRVLLGFFGGLTTEA